MKRKITYILLFVVSILSLLVGCGAKTEEAPAAEETTEVEA